jgi:hypothetical protein
MSNYLNPDFEYFVRKLRMSMRQKTLMKRTSLVSGSEMYFNPEKIDRKFMFTKGSDLRTTPLDGTRDLINFKAKLYLKSRTSRLGAETFIGDESKRGGLGKWFEEEWVDISRPKNGGGFESCGRGDADSGKYPKCVKKSTAMRMSAEEIDSAVRRKRRAETSEARDENKPINVSTFKSDVTVFKSENIPADPELYARVKAEAKKKFNVYPSAYANAWLVREYKKRGGGYRVGKDDAEELETKAGLIGSGNPLGRAVQAVGSVVTPGNSSSFTTPIRSRAYGALIPGGGGGALSRLKPNRKRQARCPSGFEFGGRFTDNRFSTCGAQLFEIPGPLALLARAARRLVNPKLPTARAENLSEVLEGNPSNARTIQISRMAQIPRTGAFQKDKFNASVQQSISTLKGAPAGEGRMIRRDGVVLRPVVPSSVLRSFSENPDMIDGAMVRAVQLPSDIGADDLALLGGPSMSKISFVAPNGVVVSIERSRPFTIGEKRKFPRMINSLAESSTKDNIISNIDNFAKNSEGAFKFITNTGDIPKPLELVTYTGLDGIERTAPRWEYETFIKPDLVSAKKKK